MDWVFAIAIYFVVWWIGMFAVLPFFARPQIESESGDVVPGTPESAPTSFPLGRFVIINTIVAAFVFSVIWAFIIFDPLGLGQVPGVVPE